MFKLLSFRLMNFVMLVAIPTSDQLAKLNNHNLQDIVSMPGGKDALTFYIDFYNYLGTSSQLLHVIQSFTAGVIQFLYNVSKGFEYLYFKLFHLFGLITTNSSIGHWYKWTQVIGISMFICLALIYMLGMIFSFDNNNFIRLKNIIYNFMLGLFFICVLPGVTNAVVGGIGTFTSAITGSGAAKVDNVNSIPDRLISSNVIDIGSVVVNAAQNNGGDLATSSAYPKHTFIREDRPLYKLPGVDNRPYYINLDQMSTAQQYKWNGLKGKSINAFLGAYGGDANLMNTDTLNNMKKQINAQNSKKAGKNSNTGSLGGALNYGYNTLLGLFGKSKGDQVLGVFKYEIADEGSIQLTELKKFPMFNPSTSWTKALSSCYLRYHVNFFSIVVGLIFLTIVLASFIIKLVGIWFKAVVIYATAGYIAVRNADQGDKIKSLIRSYFGLFELMVLDVIMLCLFVTMYISLNHTVETYMYASGYPGVSNSISIALAQLLVDVGLFYAVINGVDALDNQLGQPTGQGNMLAGLMAMRMAGQGAAKVGSLAAKPVAAAGKKAVGGAVSAYKRHKAGKNSSSDTAGNHSGGIGGQNPNGAGGPHGGPKKPRHPNAANKRQLASPTAGHQGKTNSAGSGTKPLGSTLNHSGNGSSNVPSLKRSPAAKAAASKHLQHVSPQQAQALNRQFGNSFNSFSMSPDSQSQGAANGFDMASDETSSDTVGTESANDSSSYDDSQEAEAESTNGVGTNGVGTNGTTLTQSTNGPQSNNSSLVAGNVGNNSASVHQSAGLANGLDNTNGIGNQVDANNNNFSKSANAANSSVDQTVTRNRHVAGGNGIKQVNRHISSSNSQGSTPTGTNVNDQVDSTGSVTPTNINNGVTHTTNGGGANLASAGNDSAVDDSSLGTPVDTDESVVAPDTNSSVDQTVTRNRHVAGGNGIKQVNRHANTNVGQDSTPSGVHVNDHDTTAFDSAESSPITSNPSGNLTDNSETGSMANSRPSSVNLPNGDDRNSVIHKPNTSESETIDSSDHRTIVNSDHDKTIYRNVDHSTNHLAGHDSSTTITNHSSHQGIHPDNTLTSKHLNTGEYHGDSDSIYNSLNKRGHHYEAPDNMDFRDDTDVDDSSSDGGDDGL